MVMKRILVIGGGIAGLSTAYYSLKRAREQHLPVQVIVIEAGQHWGGKITTDRASLDDGQFIIEGGPDTFLATKPYATALCKELGLGERLHGTNPSQRSTYVLNQGHLRPLPDGLAMMIPTNFGAMASTPLLSWPQKARMGLDFLLPPHSPNGDESLGAFVSRRLGRAAYENLIEPLMSGIYAGDGDQLSLASTFPHLRDMELKYGSLVKGALVMKQQAAKAGRAAQGSRSAFLTPTTGLAEIVEALVRYLQEHGAVLHLGAKAVHLSRDGVGYHVEIANADPILADGVILAAPAFASANLLQSFDPPLASRLVEIPYISTATVSLAYRLEDIPRPLDGYGYVIPRREGRIALACTWTSTKFPHRAPQGYALLRVFIGRAGQEIPWSEPELLAVARQELAQTLRIQAEPVLSRAFLWDQAMPQYNLGHPERLAMIDNAMKNHPNLALAGNGYRGIGIPDCIHSGELAAERILSQVSVEAYQSSREAFPS
jgi:oxygen-dependent protoporphyrinogen oxidase